MATTLTAQIQDSINIPIQEVLKNQHLMTLINFFGQESNASDIAIKDAPVVQYFSKNQTKTLNSEKDVFSNTLSVNQSQDNTVTHNVGNTPMITLPNILQPPTHGIVMNEVNSGVHKQELCLPIPTGSVLSQMGKHNSKSKGSKKLKRSVNAYNRVMDSSLSNSNSSPQEICNYFQTDYDKYLATAKKMKLQSLNTFNIPLPKSMPENNLTTVTAMKKNSESIQNELTPLISSIELLQQSSVSTTKTLQEKLAERQKANQLIETNLTITESKDGNKDDVIVLD